jgi:hypothetical protein
MSGRLNNLGNSHMHRFQRLRGLDDLSQAIDCLTQALSLVQKGHPQRIEIFSALGVAYAYQFRQGQNRDDLNRAIECSIQAVIIIPDKHADMPFRLYNLGNQLGDGYQHFKEP